MLLLGYARTWKAADGRDMPVPSTVLGLALPQVWVFALAPSRHLAERIQSLEVNAPAGPKVQSDTESNLTLPCGYSLGLGGVPLKILLGA